jgi:nucleoside-specific outer membrane channel protein Tsx
MYRLPPVDEEFTATTSEEPAANKGAAKESEASDDAAAWSTTEAQLLYGRRKAPSFAGGRSSNTATLTFQHASGWRFGDNYFFVDIIDDEVDDGFNDRDVYLEWYTNLSLNKILGTDIRLGFITDVGLIAGINFGADANYVKWLPGLRLSFDVPWFTLFDVAFFGFLDDNDGIGGGGALAETDSFLIDWTFALPLSIGRHDFSIEGHAEFAGPRQDALGNDVSWWILAQPQFRYDLGKTLFHAPQKLYAGIEWQIFAHKLGDPATNESAVQALIVWRF